MNSSQSHIVALSFLKSLPIGYSSLPALVSRPEFQEGVLLVDTTKRKNWLGTHCDKHCLCVP